MTDVSGDMSETIVEWAVSVLEDRTAPIGRRLVAKQALSSLREEYIVCHAAGYADPFSPWPNTLEEARRFAAEHSRNAVTGEPMTPIIKRRLTTPWERVPDITAPSSEHQP